MLGHRIKPDLIDLDPVAGRGCFESSEVMAGNPVSPNLALLLCLFENVHHAAVPRSPISLGDAMHDQRIDMVGAQLAKEPVDIIPGLLRLAAVGLGLNQVAVAGDSLHRAPEIWHRAILIGQIKERYSSIQRVVYEPVKAFLAQSSLVRGVIYPDRSRADTNQRDHQAALPQ